ncbi:hypothetical protein ANN_19742 [Periplaneta americana]|uniref:Uncharacterized protein n=1 Tax=Periplaneta americana TaxID=6978 RepID=A0ABQ8SB14_PERAM|nr:hypothetical protein ANN_19742 [Periplaneta americana]
MIMSRDQNIVRNGNIKIGYLSFEEVEKFKYLGATVTNINDTREEIKRRMNMGNACYYSVEKLLSSSLLSKNLKVRIYKTVILPVLLYGCETWTLTLREEHRLRLFENKVLRKIFGAKRDEVTGEWRKLHNTELHALYSSPDIIRNIKSRRLRWAGHVARMGESRNAYRVLVGRPEGKRPLGRPRRRWEDNIKMDLREVGYDDTDWINLAQDRTDGGLIKNDAETEQKEEKELVGSLAEKKLPTEGCTGRNGEREKSSGHKNISDEMLNVIFHLTTLATAEVISASPVCQVLRKIFGAKRDEARGEWRKLHSAEQHVLYSSPDIIRNIKSRRLRWAGHVVRMGGRPIARQYTRKCEIGNDNDDFCEMKRKTHSKPWLSPPRMSCSPEKGIVSGLACNTSAAIEKHCNSTSHRKCVEMKSEEPSTSSSSSSSSSSSFSCVGLTTRAT